MATMKGRQVITNVYLAPEVHAALKKLSGRTGIPMSFYLRQAVDRVLAENGVRVKRAKK
jgi:predicted DNA-binding protein